ncbi:hypothetical protein [Flavobacterium sp.]|uniref:hypothetical protein n=1 Tax=Flavobacterium sp. TaxID=239 RepID=UPI00403393D6
MTKIFQMLCFFCLSPVANAQFILDVSAEPKPYPVEEYYEDKVDKNIRQVSQVRTQYALNGYQESDTLSKFEYDRNGRKIRTTRYQKNKADQVYSYSYKGAREMAWEPLDRKKDNSVARTVYDKDGNIIAMYTYQMKDKDTLNTQWAVLKYENGKIVNREDRMNNRVNIATEYLWENGRLTCIRAQSAPNDKAMKFNYFEYIYSYDNDNKLTEYNVYHQVDSVRKLSYYNKYFYDKGLLVKEKFTTYTSPLNETIVDYRYAGTSPDSIVVTKEDGVITIALKYNDRGKVSEKAITTNSFTSFRDVFKLMPYGLPTKSPSNYRQVYTYDMKGNITRITQYLEDKIVSQMSYEIQYY